MKKRILSLLLSLVLLLSLASPSTIVYADGDSGMKYSKTAKDNGDGTYTITLEAYATGSKVISTITQDVPTDIILVLDQSGSMSEDMGTVSFEQYEDEPGYYWDTKYNTRNQDYYSYRHNGGSGNLWHKLSDGSFVSVSVTMQQEIKYTVINNGQNNRGGWGVTNLYDNRNNLFVKVNREFVQVTVDRERTGRSYTYTYTLPNGTLISSSKGDSSTPTINGTDDNKLYIASVDDSKTIYNYTYTDDNNNVQQIGTSTGADTVFSPTLYERIVNTSGGGTRLEAIKSAASTFVDAVAAKAAGTDGNLITTADNINHRIAVVGFASENDYGNNTELLSINGWNSGNVGVTYNSITEQNLKDVLQSMDTNDGQNLVNSAIDALDANGATRVDLGMDMAERVLKANPVPNNEKRNRVVIVFTDGSPTSHRGFDKTVADDAIKKAKAIKELGATVYSVGVFIGADASSAGTEPSQSLDENSNQLTSACNWFMHKISSNNGTPRDPSYYLSASDADTLNSIFQQISDQIETGGSSTTLDENTVIKDIIAPSFQLPAGTTANDIRLETYSYGGGNTWTNNHDSKGATATINNDKVDVTGFDFAQNWCGTETSDGTTTYRGNKLVISFEVVPKPGFLGGNGVPTNESAGIYKDSEAQKPLFVFPVPDVDVTIKDIAVTVPDKDIYLLQNVPVDTLKSGTVQVGDDVTLDLRKADQNYDLAPWQYAYVDITVEIKDKDGNTVANNLTGLTEDSNYTVSVKISPKKTTGKATEKTGERTGKINVYKPQLTFKDGEAWYGGDVPSVEELSQKLTGTKWLHDNTEADTSTMGNAPELTLSYTPDASKIQNGKINTKQDVPVATDVKIGETDIRQYTTFQHTDCEGKTCAVPNGYEFLLHIKTCQLTITKSGGAEDEPYVFTVYRDGSKYSEITIVGNHSETIYELPVGSYTITEDTNWSWRYNPSISNGASLTADSPEGSISCNNTKGKNYWLNGFSSVVKNIYDRANN